MRLAAPQTPGRALTWLIVALAAALFWLKVAVLDPEEAERTVAGWESLARPAPSVRDPDVFVPKRFALEFDDEADAKIRAQIEEGRQSQVISSSEDDFVRARLRVDDREEKVRVRLKGDFADHLSYGPSFRVKLRGRDRIWGMRSFNLQHPVTRNYLYEYAFMASMEREGVLTPRHEFVEFRLNGSTGRPYLLIEHFSKELLERQQRREGVIVKFDETDVFRMWRFRNEGIPPEDWPSLAVDPWKAGLEWFGPTRIAASAELTRQRETAIARFEAFRRGERPVSELFKVRETARWLAVTQLWGGHHGLAWNNTRAYFDGVRGRFEPIAWDGDAGLEIDPGTYADWMGWGGEFVHSRFLADPELNRAYTEELARISDAAYVQALLDALSPRLAQRARFLARDGGFSKGRWRDFTFVLQNAHWIRRALAPAEIARAYRIANPHGGWSLFVETPLEYLVELVAIETEEGSYPALGAGTRAREVFPWLPIRGYESPPAVARFELPRSIAPPVALQVRLAGLPDREPQRIPIQTLRDATRIGDLAKRSQATTALALGDDGLGPSDRTPEPAPWLPARWRSVREGDLRWVEAPTGEHVLDRDLVLGPGWGLRIPAGTTLRIAPRCVIEVHGPVEILGRESAPVLLVPRDDAWGGLVVLDSPQPSRLTHVRIAGVQPLAGTRGPERRGWMQTGGVVFAGSDLFASNLRFDDFGTEDALNLIQSHVEIENVRFRSTTSDALDGDFVRGRIHGVSLERIGGDGIDLSGSRVELRDIRADSVTDKAVSIGEGSRVVLDGLTTRRGAFALVAKDGSDVSASDVSASRTTIALGAYTKKNEYGPARLDVRGLILDDGSFSHLAQTGSEIRLDGRRLAVRRFDGAELYGP